MKRAQASYLAVCLVSETEMDGPVGMVSADVHPCAFEAHFTLVEVTPNAGR